MNAVTRSIGTGKMTVELFSAATSVSVPRKRSCSAAGCLPMTSAASAIFWAAWNSPSAVMIFARRSLRDFALS